MSATISIAVESIEWKTEDNPRDGAADEARMSDLRQSDPSLWPPLAVAFESSGKYRGIDGFARCEVAKELEVTELPVIVEAFPADIRSRAFELNQHGWALSNSERKNHAVYLRERYPDLSDREIARRCGLSPTTVAAAATVQNGQQETRDVGDTRRDLAKAAVRFGRSFDKFRALIGDSFVINLNPPQSVAAVLSEYAGDDREWLTERRAQFLEMADFMRSIAHEIKKQKTPTP